MRPPLRSEEDRAAMVRALAVGEVDVIVSSHDPQDVDTKRRPFAEASDGAIGLETLLAAALRLYHNGEIGLLPLLRAMTAHPAELLGLPSGRLEKGAPADIILVDLDQPWVVDKAQLRSRSRNSTRLKCVPTATISVAPFSCASWSARSSLIPGAATVTKSRPSRRRRAAPGAPPPA